MAIRPSPFGPAPASDGALSTRFAPSSMGMINFSGKNPQSHFRFLQKS
jgi:hypothetical protein